MDPRAPSAFRAAQPHEDLVFSLVFFLFLFVLQTSMTFLRLSVNYKCSMIFLSLKMFTTSSMSFPVSIPRSVHCSKCYLCNMQHIQIPILESAHTCARTHARTHTHTCTHSLTHRSPMPQGCTSMETIQRLSSKNTQKNKTFVLHSGKSIQPASESELSLYINCLDQSHWDGR